MSGSDTSLNSDGKVVVSPDMRALRCLLITSLLVGSLASAALAGGGSWIEPYRTQYQPGDTVVMRGDAGPGSLGELESGPFYAYLRVDPLTAAAANFHTFPNIHESDIYLGELQLKGREGWFYDISITFTLPDVPDGEYEIVYCNDPCTSGFGDFLGGWIMVKTPRLPAPPRPAHLIPYALHVI